MKKLVFILTIAMTLVMSKNVIAQETIVDVARIRRFWYC